MATNTKTAEDIRPGDVIMFLGTPNRVERIEAPKATASDRQNRVVGRAKAANGWGMTLTAGARIEVA